MDEHDKKAKFADREAHQLARKTDPGTSFAAGESQLPTLRDRQQQVLDVLRERGPMTDAELTRICCEWYGWPVTGSTARTRRAELTTIGLVVDTGEEVKLPTGRMAIVWKAA